MNEIIYKIEKDINTIKIIDGKLYFGASGKSKSILQRSTLAMNARQFHNTEFSDILFDKICSTFLHLDFIKISTYINEMKKESSLRLSNMKLK